MNLLAALPQNVRYAIFAFPMVAMLLVGAVYLGYSAIICDPLYTVSAEAGGYEAGSAVVALRALLPAGYEGDKTMPVPSRNFGTECAVTTR
jgi:hypothetical protein